jgi:outer membrane protein assembly factor BamB
MEGGSGAHTHAADAAPAPPLEQAWRYDAEGGFGAATALAVQDRVLVATRHGEVHLVDARSGDRLGKMAFGDEVDGAPVLLDGRLLVVPLSGGKYGLIGYDLVTGKRAWVREDDPHAAGLLAVGDVLVAAALDGAVRGLDPRTGAERWAIRPDTLARFFATPTALESGLAAVADDRGRVTALDPATGRVAWTASAGAPVHESPAAAAGLLVVPTTRGRLVALDQHTGAERWVHRADDEAARFASPAVHDGAVVVGASDGVLRRLHITTGSVMWTHRFDGNVAAAPLLADGRVYVGTLDEQLAVLDLATGVVLWSTELPGRVKSAPVVSGGLLVVPTEPRHLYAFRPATPDGVATAH